MNSVCQPYQPCHGYLADTRTSKGLGVFAAKNLAQGEVVEIAPVVQLEGDYDHLHFELRRRVFDWERLANRSGVHALALGYGSMYNHANQQICVTHHIKTAQPFSSLQLDLLNLAKS